MNTIVLLIFAAALLFFGRKLYWLFVAGIGFLAGMYFGADLFAGQPEWMILLCALLIGAVGAVLAILFQRVAVGIAGFFAGGHLSLLLLRSLGFPQQDFAAAIAFVAGGIVAAIVFVYMLDWALIVVSSLLGSATIAGAADQPYPTELFIFAGLFGVGVIVQAIGMRALFRREAFARDGGPPG